MKRAFSSSLSKPELPPAPRFGPGFQGLSESSIRRILERSSYEEYAPRRWLYRQGEPAQNFYILKSGLVSLSEVNSAGDETIIRFILPGEAIGYSAICAVDEHLLSAQALQPSIAIVWSRAAGLELIQQIPKAAANLLSTMTSDLIYYYHHIRRFKMDSLEKRIQWGLSELSRVYGQSTPQGIVIHDVGHEQLARLAGTNIYSISRELKKLESSGVLRKQRGRIVLLDGISKDGKSPVAIT